MERGTKIECMLRAGYQYPEDIYALLRKNEQQYVMCHDCHNSVFDFREISTPQLGRHPMSYIC